MAAVSSVASLHLPPLPPAAARASKADAAHSSSHRHFANPFGDDAATGSSAVFPAAAIAAAGRDLLSSIVAETWRPDTGLLDCGEGVRGTDLYVGYGGVAAALLRRGMLLRDADVLKQAAAMLDACIKTEEDRAASHKARGRAPQIDVTMIMGLPGLWALHAVAAHAVGDTATRDKRIAEIIALAKAGYVNGPGAVTRSLPCEMLYGRAGFLYACLFVNTHCSGAGAGSPAGGAGSAAASGSGAQLIPDSVTAPIVAEIIDIGRRGSRERAAAASAGSKAASAVPPLFYTWHGSPYLGAAHGLAGICHTLLHYPLNPAAHADVVGSLRYLLSVRYPSGNMPLSDDGRHTDASTDKLVHWCHGATGLALTMARAWELTREPDFATAAVEAAEVVWQRGLLTKLGLCHGVAGNAYAFLAVRRIALQIARDSEAAAAGAPSAAALAGTSSGAVGAHGSAAPQAAEWAELAELSLRRARCFASFLVFGPPARHGGAAASTAAPPKEHYWERLVAAGEMHGGDRAFSLYEGATGAAWALLDIGTADDARALPPSFPGFEL